MPDSQSNSPVEKELTPLAEVKNRFTGEVICSGETIAKAAASFANLSFANLSSADLSYADLRSANLRSANLRSANLSYADLSSADLSFANLSSANLSSADLSFADLSFANLSSANLSSANLSYADLSFANLSYANLSYADLRSAKISWRSHDLISEILKRSAGDDIEKLKVAGLILVCREKCWGDFLSIRDPLFGWAIDVLREWIGDSDGHPECLDVVESDAGNS